MNVDGRPMRTIWLADDGRTVEIIDQTRLPHELVVARLGRLADAARAIRDMQVRGAPLIGATAAYGMALALAADPSDAGIAEAAAMLAATRPTAVNLRWALDEMRRALAGLPAGERACRRTGARRRDRRRGRRDQPRHRRARPAADLGSVRARSRAKAGARS